MQPLITQQGINARSSVLGQMPVCWVRSSRCDERRQQPCKRRFTSLPWFGYRAARSLRSPELALCRLAGTLKVTDHFTMLGHFQRKPSRYVASPFFLVKGSHWASSAYFVMQHQILCSQNFNSNCNRTKKHQPITSSAA